MSKSNKPKFSKAEKHCTAHAASAPIINPSYRLSRDWRRNTHWLQAVNQSVLGLKDEELF